MVVTREVEWDDETRSRAVINQLHEDGLCRCGCGQPMDEAHDKSQHYVVDEYTCQAGRALDIVRRRREDEAQKAGKAQGWDDGLHFYARKATEADFAKHGRAPVQQEKVDDRRTKLQRVRDASTRGKGAAR